MDRFPPTPCLIRFQEQVQSLAFWKSPFCASLATLRYSKTSHNSFKPKAIKKYTPRNNSKRSFRVSFNALDKHPSDQSETSKRTLFGLCPSCRTTTSCYNLCRTVTPKPAAVATNGRKQKKKRVRKMLHQIHKLNKPRGQFQTNMVEHMTQKVKIDDAKSFAQKS